MVDDRGLRVTEDEVRDACSKMRLSNGINAMILKQVVDFLHAVFCI